MNFFRRGANFRRVLHHNDASPTSDSESRCCMRTGDLHVRVRFGRIANIRMADTIFGKIAKGEAQADIVYEDDRALVFRDLNPQAPTHLLVIPRKPLATLSEADQDDEALLGHLLLVANRAASEEGLENFRVVVNNGAGAGQTVFHLHIHVLGGRSFSWPPG